jgi:hypothetical protein
LQEALKEFSEFNLLLKFFNKKQDKFKAAIAFDESDKVGQGIASMDKNINVLFSVYARYILCRTQNILKRNKRNIFLATHESESDFNRSYLEILDNINYTDSWVCNDFSEWDASFRTPMTQFMGDLMKFAGCPRYIADWFIKSRAAWKMVYHSKYGNCTLFGEEKQFSGNPFTICENTICNMALCYSMFDYKGHRCSFFKGDDSAVMCDLATIKKIGRFDLTSITGHKLKLHHYPVGEFAGFVLTKYGLFPDVLRYATKFLGKYYRDKEHYNEVVSSIKERVALVVNEDQINYGVFALTQFYPNMSTNDFRVLFDFIRTIHKFDFNEFKTKIVRNIYA